MNQHTSADELKECRETFERECDQRGWFVDENYYLNGSQVRRRYDESKWEAWQAAWNRRPTSAAEMTDADLTRIYNEANGIGSGKRVPITTERIFTAMRACFACTTQPTQAAAGVKVPEGEHASIMAEPKSCKHCDLSVGVICDDHGHNYWELTYKSGRTEVIDRAPDSFEVRECDIRRLVYIDAAPSTPIAKQQCRWKHDGNPDYDAWESSCGQAWTFIEGTPQDNGIRFCQHCGKPVVFAPPSDSLGGEES